MALKAIHTATGLTGFAPKSKAPAHKQSPLAMPNPDKPSTTAWQFTLDQHIGKPDAYTFLVGHSLGCITLLHFLSRQQPQKIGGLLLAAGFADTLPPLPALDAYIKAASPDFDILRKSTCPNTAWFPTTTPMFRPN